MFVIKSFQDRWLIQWHSTDERYTDEYSIRIVCHYIQTMKQRSNEKKKRVYSLNCVSRLMKNSINRSKIYPAEGVISFSRRGSWHSWRIFRTKIGSWSGDDCKSMVKIKSMNVRFSWSAKGSVLHGKLCSTFQFYRLYFKIAMRLP